MKLAAAILALALIPNAVAEPEDMEADCKAEGGCVLITQAALRQMVYEAYAHGVETTRRSCKKYL